jgi:Uma2 family endonuclease
MRVVSRAEAKRREGAAVRASSLPNRLPGRHGHVPLRKTARLADVLSEALRGKAIVWAQSPIVLGDLSAPQPDLALLRYRDDYYGQAHPGSADILLLIEVADTSLAHDRDTKLPLYARFRVPEVWIVDIPGRHLDIHREPDGARFTYQFRVSNLSRVEIASFPGLMLDLRGLF